MEFCIGILFIIIIILCIYLCRYKRIAQDRDEDARAKREKEINDQLIYARQSLNDINAQIQSQTELCNTLYETKIKDIDNLVESEHQRKLLLIKDRLENEFKIDRKRYDAQAADLNRDIALLGDSLREIAADLEDLQCQREAINKEIQFERQELLSKDIHRIILSKEDKEDIKFLLSIDDKIHNREILHKLIWSTYLQKPFGVVLKNLFGANPPKNVIYCIESLDGKSKYIGKTAGAVSDRWTAHIKSSLGIGTISHQNIHDAMFGHWDEFYFSVLEVVKDGEKLSDREHYYIKFFQSDVIGYNIKA